jgi:hypothetical protein
MKIAERQILRDMEFRERLKRLPAVYTHTAHYKAGLRKPLAALAVLADLSDRSGVGNDDDVKRKIVESMAAIIRKPPRTNTGEILPN